MANPTLLLNIYLVKVPLQNFHLLLITVNLVSFAALQQPPTRVPLLLEHRTPFRDQVTRSLLFKTICLLFFKIHKAGFTWKWLRFRGFFLLSQLVFNKFRCYMSCFLLSEDFGVMGDRHFLRKLVYVIDIFVINRRLVHVCGILAHDFLKLILGHFEF